jgi:single-strand DNA-binding protein
VGVNKVILIGNVGKDPEVKNISDTLKVATFPLATSENYKNKDNETVTNTEWHNIVVWRGLAGVVEQWIKKGSPVYIEGKIRTRNWDDKDGQKHYRTEVIVDNLQMLGSKPEGKPQAAKSNTSTSGNEIPPPEEDDLPF